jgi:hypothetical protein
MNHVTATDKTTRYVKDRGSMVSARCQGMGSDAD